MSMWVGVRKSTGVPETRVLLSYNACAELCRHDADLKVIEVMPVPEKTPKAAFIQKPLNAGITVEEMIELIDKVECEQVIPLEVQANSSCALGVISLDAAEELDYDYDNLIRNVASIIEDRDNETEYGQYNFDGFPVYIGY